MDSAANIQRLLDSERWIEFLESTAVGLKLNLVILFPDSAGSLSTQAICPVCKKDFAPLTPQQIAAALDVSANRTPWESVVKINEDPAVVLPLRGGLVVVARACSCSMEEEVLQLPDMASIAQKLLNSFQTALGEGFTGGQRAIHLAALRQMNHIILSLFRGDGESAVRCALDLVLSALVILLDARGSWLEYRQGDQSVLLIKGDSEAVKSQLKEKRNQALEVGINNSCVCGRMGVLEPDSPATAHLSFLAQECSIVFEIDHLYKLVQAKMNRVLGAIGSAVLLVDRYGNISYANSAAGQLLGAKIIALIGQPSADLDAPWTPYLQDGKERRACNQMDLLRLAGQEKRIDWQANPLQEDSALAGWVIIIDDRTDYYRWQEAARRAELLATTATMVGTLAHELRNPLSAAKGLLQLMGRRHDPEKTRGYTSLILREMDRVTNLLNEFLLLGKAANMDPEPLDLLTFLQELLPLLEGEASGLDVEIVASLEPVPQVSADQGQLTQVLLNLVRNAIQAVGQEGRVTISLCSSGDGAALTVRDNGQGLPPEVLDKLFMPFFTTKRSGTGLGLAVSQAIVYNHGGQITAANHPEGGAVFTVLLPAYAAAGGKGKLDVLMAVGDEIVRYPAEQALRGAGLKVATCGDPDAALSLAGRYEPALLMLDQPALNSRDAENIRKVWPGLKILAVGKPASYEDIEGLVYIPRPLNYDRLVSQVRSMLLV